MVEVCVGFNEVTRLREELADLVTSLELSHELMEGDASGAFGFSYTISEAFERLIVSETDATRRHLRRRSIEFACRAVQPGLEDLAELVRLVVSREVFVLTGSGARAASILNEPLDRFNDIEGVLLFLAGIRPKLTLGGDQGSGERCDGLQSSSPHDGRSDTVSIRTVIDAHSESSVGGVTAPTVGESGRVGNDPAAGGSQASERQAVANAGAHGEPFAWMNLEHTLNFVFDTVGERTYSRMKPSWRPWNALISDQTYWALPKAIEEARKFVQASPSDLCVFACHHWTAGYEHGRRDAVSLPSNRELPPWPSDDKSHQGSSPRREAAREQAVAAEGRASLAPLSSGCADGREAYETQESSVGGVTAPTVGEGGRVGNDPAAGGAARSRARALSQSICRCGVFRSRCAAFAEPDVTDLVNDVYQIAMLAGLSEKRCLSLSERAAAEWSEQRRQAPSNEANLKEGGS